MMHMQPLTADESATVEANLGLVHHTVRRMRVPDTLVEDAVQDGVFGLARAVQKYDPSLGYAFSTYAVAWIRQAVNRGRGLAEGHNYRKAQREGNGYEAPLSLDAQLLTGDPDDGHTLADAIADPDALDPAAVAEATSLLEQLRRELGDEAYADLVSGDTLLEQARRRGVSKQRMHQRRHALTVKAHDVLGQEAA